MTVDLDKAYWLGLLASVVLPVLVSFGTAVLSHFGLWKPTGVAGRAQDSLITARR